MITHEPISNVYTRVLYTVYNDQFNKYIIVLGILRSCVCVCEYPMLGPCNLAVSRDIIPALPNEFHRYDKTQNLRLSTPLHKAPPKPPQGRFTTACLALCLIW